MNNFKTKYIDSIIETSSFLKPIKTQIYDAFYGLCRCYENKGKALICGNGGSAADAEHITGELMKGFLLKRPIPECDAKKLADRFPNDASGLEQRLQRGLPAISLVSQTSLITAVANDISADMIFAQQVYVYGSHGDILIAISTGGNAKNVINAAIIALSMGMKVLALTGETGGALREYCDVLINVPLNETYLIQEAHIKIYHAICADLEMAFFVHRGGSDV